MFFRQKRLFLACALVGIVQKQCLADNVFSVDSVALKGEDQNTKVCYDIKNLLPPISAESETALYVEKVKPGNSLQSGAPRETLKTNVARYLELVAAKTFLEFFDGSPKYHEPGVLHESLYTTKYYESNAPNSVISVIDAYAFEGTIKDKVSCKLDSKKSIVDSLDRSCRPSSLSSFVGLFGPTATESPSKTDTLLAVLEKGGLRNREFYPGFLPFFNNFEPKLKHRLNGFYRYLNNAINSEHYYGDFIRPLIEPSNASKTKDIFENNRTKFMEPFKVHPKYNENGIPSGDFELCVNKRKFEDHVKEKILDYLRHLRASLPKLCKDLKNCESELQNTTEEQDNHAR